MKDFTFQKNASLTLLFTFLMLFTFIGFGQIKKVETKNKTAKIAKKSTLTKKKITLVINAGHGGKDPGKPSSSSRFESEKDINLEIALQLGEYIEEKVPNVKVIQTRKEDIFVSLDEIVDIANNNNADYFISIHCNSNPNRYVRGTKTHIHSHSFKKSKALALQIEHEFKIRAARKSKGVFSAKDRGQNLQVLQYTEMPGALVEVGFLSNPNEERYLNSEDGQAIIASAIYRAFRDYLIIADKLEKESRREVYKVQILSAERVLSQDYPKFRKLGLRVEKFPSPPNAKYKYRYLVGREYDKELAEKLAKEVRKLGFKDAFVVKLKG